MVDMRHHVWMSDDFEAVQNPILHCAMLKQLALPCQNVV